MSCIVIGFIVFIATVLILAMRVPDQFMVARGIHINATPDKIFPLINSPRIANSWMPWLTQEPGVEVSYTGPESGVDASTSWRGRKNGEGIATVITSHPNEIVITRLEMLKPFKCTNTSDISLRPDQGGTYVTWTMRGTNNMMTKIMGLFMHCEAMMGPMFDQGLSNLKAMAEK